MADNEEIYTLKAFRFIRDFIRQKGFSPSQREIADGTFLSPTTMLIYLAKLEAWGWITREYHIARSVRIGEHAPSDEKFAKLWQDAHAGE